MLFTQYYSSELQRLSSFFSAASKADEEFHHAWKEGCAKLGLSRYKKTDRYGQTLQQFHQTCREIDEIVSTAFLHAKLGDLTQLPTLFAYITYLGRYFRSGYQRTEIWRFFKKIELSDEQCRILRNIVLNQIAAAGPEFAEIARTARKINSADFRENIFQIQLHSKKEYVSKRTKRLLSLLETKST